MINVRLAIPPAAADRIRRLPPDLKRAIREALRAIRADPLHGKPLEKELRDYRKYRVRRFRIVYEYVRTMKTVRILAVGPRRTIYEEVAEQLRRG